MKLTCVGEVTVPKSLVNSIILLQDGRLASCDDDNKINIFNPSNNYQCELTISDLAHYVNSTMEI